MESIFHLFHFLSPKKVMREKKGEAKAARRLLMTQFIIVVIVKRIMLEYMHG
jgi:hypothetical protein